MMNPLVKRTVEKIGAYFDFTEEEKLAIAVEVGNAIYKALLEVKENPNYNLKGGSDVDDNTLGNLEVVFANCNKQKIEVSYGYFVHWHHDLQGGIFYNGIFETKAKAKEYADSQEKYDEIKVLFLPYVKFEGGIYALWKDTACNLKIDINE